MLQFGIPAECLLMTRSGHRRLTLLFGYLGSPFFINIRVGQFNGEDQPDAPDRPFGFPLNHAVDYER
jgi:hypothetical protein